MPVRCPLSRRRPSRPFLPIPAQSAGAAPGLAGDDFAALFKSPLRARSAHFSLHWRPGVGADSRFGMVVSKRLARTSVRRNLIKRQARALFAQWTRGGGGGGNEARDVVLRLTRNPRLLARAPQFAELQSLFTALT